MRIINFLALAVCVLFMVSCEKETVSSNQITTKEYDLSGYTTIASSGLFNIEVYFSETERIEVETSDNIHQYIVVEKEGSTLILDIEDNANIQTSTPIKVTISTALVNSYKGTGKVNYRLMDKLVTENASIDLSGITSLSGPVDVQNLTIKIAGQAKTDLVGQVDFMKVDASGSASVKDCELIANTLDVKMEGAVEVYVTAIEEMYIDGSGAATLYYKGSAEIKDISLSGASKLIKLD